MRADRLAGGRAEPLSVSGASVLSSTTRADGFVIVDQGRAKASQPALTSIVWLYA